MDHPTPPEQSPTVTRGQAFRIHVGLFLCLLLCIPAGIFELTRALGGNELSWAYVFEWPLFAGFGIYMWWKLLHGAQTARSKSPGEEAIDNENAEDSEELEAWNRYLKELNAQNPGEDR